MLTHFNFATISTPRPFAGAIKSFVSFVKQTRTTIEATSDETTLKKSNIMMIIILTFAHRLTLWIC